MLEISTGLVRRLSPDSLSIMEFKSELDVTIFKAILRFPLAAEVVPTKWNLTFARELDMTLDSASI